MNVITRLASAALAFMIAGCTGNNPDTTMSEADGKIRFERNTRFDGRILSVDLARQDGTKENFNSVRDEWYSWGYVPVRPGYAGRRWGLLKTLNEGTSLVYTLVSWNNDDPTDYLAAGYWLYFPGEYLPRFALSQAETSFFIDGPEIDVSSPPALPVEGEATYVGNVGGVHQYMYGSDWVDAEEPVSVEEFTAAMAIRADFFAQTLTGCIGCLGDIALVREHLYSILGRRVQEPLALPQDYMLQFGVTDINSNGTFEHTDVTVTHPERTVTQADGFWGGNFSNVPDADGNPRLVTGLTQVEFDEADGSQGSFTGIFLTFGPSYRPPDGITAP